MRLALCDYVPYAIKCAMLNGEMPILNLDFFLKIRLSNIGILIFKNRSIRRCLEFHRNGSESGSWWLFWC